MNSHFFSLFLSIPHLTLVLSLLSLGRNLIDVAPCPFFIISCILLCSLSFSLGENHIVRRLTFSNVVITTRCPDSNQSGRCASATDRVRRVRDYIADSTDCEEQQLPFTVHCLKFSIGRQDEWPMAALLSSFLGQAICTLPVPSHMSSN